VSGAPRLRQVRAIGDGNGAAAWLYDLERTYVIPVPPALRGSVPAALAAAGAGDAAADNAVMAWLASEDVITSEVLPGRSDAGRIRLPVVTDVSIDLAGSCNMGCGYCFEDDIDSRKGPMSADTMRAAVEFAFRQAGDAPRVVVHFGSGETLIRFPMLVELVAAAEARAAQAGKTVGFELTTNATLVTPEMASFLRERGFNVRVSCDGPPAVHDRFRPMLGGKPSYALVERGLTCLLEHLGDRVTVNSVLAFPTRLRELWAWAKALGLRRYHVIKVGARPGRDLNLDAGELASFTDDLAAICDEIVQDLEAGRRPIDYQPVTKIVRRLMVPEPVTRFCGVAGSYLGVASNGGVYPCFRHLGVERYRLGDIAAGVDDERRRAFLSLEAADVDARPVCRACWARYLCGGGCYADSSVYGPDRATPQVHHCPYWQAEIEAAIRTYGRLLELDPLHCVRLFGDDAVTLLDEDGLPAFVQRKNCA
jgi:uncharacterized protein